MSVPCLGPWQPRDQVEIIKSPRIVLPGEWPTLKWSCACQGCPRRSLAGGWGWSRGSCWGRRRSRRTRRWSWWTRRGSRIRGLSSLVCARHKLTLNKISQKNEVAQDGLRHYSFKGNFHQSHGNCFAQNNRSKAISFKVNKDVSAFWTIFENFGIHLACQHLVILYPNQMY